MTFSVIPPVDEKVNMLKWKVLNYKCIISTRVVNMHIIYKNVSIGNFLQNHTLHELKNTVVIILSTIANEFYLTFSARVV